MTTRHPMATWVGPPDSNWGGSRSLSTIGYIVVHRTVGTVDMALSRFRTEGQQASSTYILGHPLGRYGTTLFQVCERNWVPWTNSTYIDPGGNPHSITFEVEDLGRYYDPAPLEQLQVLAQAIRWEADQDDVPLTRDYILGHRECDGGIATACPAAMFGQLDELVAMANSPQEDDMTDEEHVWLQETRDKLNQIWEQFSRDPVTAAGANCGDLIVAIKQKVDMLEQPAVELDTTEQPIIDATTMAAVLAADQDFLAAIAKAVNDELARRQES